MNDEQRAQPTEEDLRGALVLPGFELPEVFPLTRGQLFTVGLQPEDHSVLAFLKLRDPRKPATKEGLAEEMQAIGWKMGKTRFDGIFGRLKAAGHIKHVSVYNPELGRPQWQIQFFANPSYNDEYVNSVLAASSQVGAESLETGDSQTEQLFETPETRISQGQKGSQISGDPEGNPWKPAFPSDGVPAGQGRNSGNPVFGAPPPHPPEEVTTSSPTPHADTDGRSSLPSQTGEGREFSPKEIHAAESFLQRLSNPWNAGKATATKCAPKLLRVMDAQGWPSIFDVDKRVLEHDITKNPGGITRHAQVLPGRIADLSLYEVVAPAPRQTSAPGPIEENRGPISTESITSLLEALQRPSL